jgi:hypothetical protein
VLRGERLCRGPPGAAGHEVVQGVHGVAAVLAGGVGVAADAGAVLGGVVAGEAAGDFLLGFEGPDAALADVVGPRRRMRMTRMMRMMRRIRLGFG